MDEELLREALSAANDDVDRAAEALLPLAPPSVEAGLSHEGWLHQLRSGTFGRKTKRRRWFVLHNSWLFLHKSSKTPKPLLRLDLSESVVHIRNRRDFCFELLLDPGKLNPPGKGRRKNDREEQKVLYASTEQELTLWVEKLRAASRWAREHPELVVGEGSPRPAGRLPHPLHRKEAPRRVEEEEEKESEKEIPRRGSVIIPRRRSAAAFADDRLPVPEPPVFEELPKVDVSAPPLLSFSPDSGGSSPSSGGSAPMSLASSPSELSLVSASDPPQDILGLMEFHLHAPSPDNKMDKFFESIFEQPAPEMDPDELLKSVAEQEEEWLF